MTVAMSYYGRYSLGYRPYSSVFYPPDMFYDRRVYSDAYLDFLDRRRISYQGEFSSSLLTDARRETMVLNRPSTTPTVSILICYILQRLISMY